METIGKKYYRDQSQLDLTLKMLLMNARTKTISHCTGLSHDRIRKIYQTYVEQPQSNLSKRQRGRAPSSTHCFLRSQQHQLEASTLGLIFLLTQVIKMDNNQKPRYCAAPTQVLFGQRLCRAYQLYQILYPNPKLSIEQALSLCNHLCGTEDLSYGRCRDCQSLYVKESFNFSVRRCSPCSILK